MKVFELIDLLQRRINSLLFRIVMIFYSLIVYFSYPNEFHLYVYAFVAILYLIIYIWLIKLHQFRIFNDLFFIFVFLYAKDPNDVVLFIFLLLPAINSINFSGVKKTPFLYLYTYIFYLLLVCIYNNDFSSRCIRSTTFTLISFGFLWFIDYYTSLRSKIRTIRESLNEIVDTHYIDKKILNKPHKIYRLLIMDINKLIKKPLVERILCFTTICDPFEKIVLVNASTFIWQYNIGEKKYLSLVRDKKHIYNTPIVIDDIDYNLNLSMRIEVEGNEYIFMFLLFKKIPFYYSFIGFFRTIEPSLLKIARILLYDKEIRELKNAEILKLSERSLYVSRAVTTMHFIRNRLGPINNMTIMVDNLQTVPNEKVAEFKILLDLEKERVKTEIKNITFRADYLLEKSNNPFNFCETKRVTTGGIYSLLKRNFTTFFPDEEIQILSGNNSEKKYLDINEEGFHIFISDWLSNIKKYKKDYVSLTFEIADTLNLRFHNDFNLPLHEVVKLIQDLMSNDRTEIMKRVTHGLYQIKSALDDMSIPFTVGLNEAKDVLFFELKIKIFNDETCNI